jgi:hypothetical protein
MVDSVLSKSKRRNYLWVEGKDDEGIMYGLLNSHSVTSKSKPNRFIANDEVFGIKEHDGLPNLLAPNVISVHLTRVRLAFIHG